MYYKEHCKRCKEQLGEEFKEVHQFLDQFFIKFGWRHRKIFHHTYGVEIIRMILGDDAAEAAKLHIKDDCLGEIPTPEDWLDANYWLNVG